MDGYQTLFVNAPWLGEGTYVFSRGQRLVEVSRGQIKNFINTYLERRNWMNLNFVFELMPCTWIDVDCFSRGQMLCEFIIGPYEENFLYIISQKMKLWVHLHYTTYCGFVKGAIYPVLIIFNATLFWMLTLKSVHMTLKP